MKEIVRVENVEKIYHTEEEEVLSLRDISFSVYEGEFLSIVGPSGCGKSTILSILCGLLDYSSGSIHMNENYKIAYMLQDDALLPYKTVLENCLLGLKVEHALTEESKDYVISLLDTYGLHDFIHQYPSHLSGGMRQRVALIRTLAIKPDILLLDEAMSSLDYQSRLMIGEDIYNIIKKEGKTAIMVTHDLGEAVSISDRILVLSKRPSIVKKCYVVELENKDGPIARRGDPNFSKYFNSIWRDLND